MGGAVVVLGAGVAGLTAAHELVERGFEVTVYERRPMAGGKARSFPATITKVGSPDTAKGELSSLPAEHGFHFFPGFYRNVFDTMKRTPVSEGSRQNVLGNLRHTETLLMLQLPGGPLYYPTQLWRLDSLRTWRLRVIGPNPVRTAVGMEIGDVQFFSRLVWKLLRSSDERGFAEYEPEDWWTFAQAQRKSPRYQEIMRAITRLLVAAQADELSVRTGGSVMLALGRGMVSWRGHRPKVLNGPTSDAWITPWREYLERRRVRFEFGATVESLRVQDGAVTEVVVSRDGRTFPCQARWYVAALPVEIMKDIVERCPELTQADARFGRLKNLCTRSMNGIMIYLRKDQRMVDGHTIYLDSPWALTSISQASFWPGYDLASMSGGEVHGILSINISNWDTCGDLIKKPASECTGKEVFTEVYAQLRRHLNGIDEYASLFEPENIYGWCLDPAVYMPNPQQEFNLEPLLINTAGSWENRPPATTAIKNLFLAGDYVRTYTDLATMEAANESARRAVNGILRKSKSTQPLCTVWPRHESLVFAPLRWLDRRSLKKSIAAERYDWALRQLAELHQKGTDPEEDE
jgi:uncharacterized protein with NAD-binding domain and iron-sulfur cluster